MNNLLELTFVDTIWQIILPLVLMAVDIITGYYNAWEKKEIQSTKMRNGIGKKIAEIAYILIGFLFSRAFDVTAISQFVSIYIIYMELVSVAENCKKLGVKMPKIISDKLKAEQPNLDAKIKKDTKKSKKDTKAKG